MAIGAGGIGAVSTEEWAPREGLLYFQNDGLTRLTRCAA
jgi:hypothetical protein